MESDRVILRGRAYDREREPQECPLCHFSVKPQSLFWAQVPQDGPKSHHVEEVYQCPRSECGGLFIARYVWSAALVGKLRLSEVVPATPLEPRIPEEVKNVSSLFFEIYSQSMAAESHHLDQIAGVGYRKALEYLVKDYCVTFNQGKEEEIKAAQLGPCIENYVDSEQVKACAKRAAWLGNDETHYVRRWPEKDINDLKVLIRLTINWIHNDILTRGYTDDMPRGRA